MKFSIFFPPERPGGPSFSSPDFLAAFVRAVEGAGFDAVKFGDHPAPPDEWLTPGRGHQLQDAMVGLAAVGALSPRLRLMTSVLVLPYHHPLVVAKAVATLDRFSGGRVDVGVAAGYLEPEYEALGVDFATRNDRFDEALLLLRQAWTGTTISHHGRFFTAAGVAALPTPVQDPVPVWIGGNSKLTLRRVAERADGWMAFSNPPAVAARRHSGVLGDMDDLRRLMAYLRGHADAVGRTAPIDVMCEPLAGGTPGTTDWDRRAYLDDVRAQAELGVTWQSVIPVGDDVAGVLDMVRSYGDAVIGPVRDDA